MRGTWLILVVIVVEGCKGSDGDPPCEEGSTRDCYSGNPNPCCVSSTEHCFNGEWMCMCDHWDTECLGYPDSTTDPDTDADAPDDVTDDPDASDVPGDVGGCDQELPGVVGEYASHCGETDPAHCSITECPTCTICLADIVCGPFGGPCECCGDGSCAVLCSDDGQCADDESCRDIGWFQFYDTYTAMLRVCWPDSSLRGSVCP